MLLRSLLAFTFLWPVCGYCDFGASVFVNSRANGIFDVFLRVSPEDNFGIASYGIPLRGDILTVDHNSPHAILEDSFGNLHSIGFSFIRSQDNQLLLFASQNTFTPSSLLIAGFGQVGGDLEDFGKVISGEQVHYGANLMIASGTWDAAGQRPSVDMESADFGANLFTTTTLLKTAPALFSKITGDFDHNGVTDATDIDLLCTGIGSGEFIFDLNFDDSVDDQDVRILVEDELGSVFGDANLDGTFNTGDLIQVFQFGEYEDGLPNNSGWRTGDWNCDRDFDTSDLISVFQKGTYTRDAIVVPETASILFVILPLLLKSRDFTDF